MKVRESNSTKKEKPIIKYNEINNNKLLQKIANHIYNKNNKEYFINENQIETFDILNTNSNYKNIIINNMLTPNKKISIKNNTSTRKKNNFINNRKFFYSINSIDKDYQSLGQKMKVNLNKKNIIKSNLINQEQEKINDINNKYKPIIYEKNNLINKLKKELEYYKNNYNINLLFPSNYTIETTNNINLRIKNKKNNSNKDNLKNKIKNFFSAPKKDINSIKYKFNQYNNLNTHMGKITEDYINYNNSKGLYDFASHFNNTFDKSNHKINFSENNYSKHDIKILLNNYSQENELSLNNNYNKENIHTTNNNFYRCNSNIIPKKNNKLKLDFQKDDFILDSIYNDNNIEINKNNKNFSIPPNNIFYSLNLYNSNNEVDNKIDIFNNFQNNIKNNEEQKSTKNVLKNQKYYFNNYTPNKYYLNNKNEKKYNIETNNSVLLKEKNNNSYFNFEYIENLEDIKQRMNNLIEGLFSIINSKKKNQ